MLADKILEIGHSVTVDSWLGRYLYKWGKLETQMCHSMSEDRVDPEKTVRPMSDN